MGSPAIPGVNENSLIVHRLEEIDERFDRLELRLDKLEERLGQLEATVGALAVAVAKMDTKINIVMGILGAAGAGVFFLLFRLLLG